MSDRRFFMNGTRQMVGELGGTVHEADPNDADLLVALARQSEWITAEIAADDSLDAAWAEAEAALPEYALLRLSKVPGWSEKFGQEPCEARIEWWRGDDRPVESATGSTPAAALRALAAKLREVGR